ncbi:Dehydrogenase str4 [Mycena sanguinolenta]|uniref:Dehydrogenase str4 n=1 Tax=Mycena sanguinolenta TaxID=230812 RepID=A0A8H6Y274_9AGAR|nr:Dehydrogenase str4 [Mycena sanguinolenta]
MGSGHSTVSNPRKFAWPIAFGDDLSTLDKSQPLKRYDYVVVGGGTAGCVIAARLSENPNINVLLVEAGKSNKGVRNSMIPLAFPLLMKSKYDWNYETVGNATLGGRTSYWPRGRLLGGTSAINGSMYHRCSPEDFSAWVNEGANGWDYENMKHYFRKAEKYTPHSGYPAIDPALHGTDGPATTSHGALAPISKDILQASINVGIPHVQDFNTDAGTTGVGLPLVELYADPHVSLGVSAATGYLTPAVMRRPNLTIAVECQTEKVVMSSNEKVPRATGVIFSTKRDGQRFFVPADREVILSGGVIGTPQILKLSGLGPADELAKHKIPLVRDLPAVGEYLQDHFSSGPILIRAKRGTWDWVLRPLGAIWALTKWFLFGSGPLASLSVQVACFVRSDNKRLPMHDGAKKYPIKSLFSGPTSPDIELFFAPFLAPPLNGPPYPFGGLTAGTLLLKPASYGSVKLASTNPWDYPNIDANYLADESDMALCIMGMRLLMRIARTKPFVDSLNLPKDSNDKTSLFWPTDCNPDTVSDDDLEAWTRLHGQSTGHPTSSARMGSSPSTSVVDSRLKVHGVEGLRVCDASCFPTQVSGHPTAVIVAVAERAADLIKGVV